MALAGLAWLAFLSLPFGVKYFPYIVACAVREGVLTMWLLVVGMNGPWRQEKASPRQVGGA